MSVAAVMMVKDEADVVERTIRHLLEQGVDQIFASDNLSTDGTTEILHALRADVGSESLQVGLDEVVEYFQSAKTTELAQRALAHGHSWVVPCDADEWWCSGFGTVRSILDLADGNGVDVVPAELYDHIPTALDDPAELDPVARIGWRFLLPGELPKVACRLRPDLVIEAGNHGAHFARGGQPVRIAPGLIVRHFTWRSADQYVRKIRNGWEAYAGTGLPDNVGAHWRNFGSPDEETWEERVRAHYQTWFYSPDPRGDARLIYDPAP